MWTLKIGVAAESALSVTENAEVRLFYNGTESWRNAANGWRGGASDTGVGLIYGTGSPESAITAPIGSLYMRTDGSNGTATYRKTSGTGNTGWTSLELAPRSGRMYRNTSAQAINATTWTKVQLNAESFDQHTKGTMDTATNYRYTANEAVTVYINAMAYFDSPDAASEAVIAIYKNGSLWSAFYDMNNHTGARAMTVGISDVMSLATNDYVEMYVWCTTAENIGNGEGSTYMTILEMN